MTLYTTPPRGRVFRGFLTGLLCGALLLDTTACAARRVPAPRPSLPPAVLKPLQAALLQSYDELFRTASKLEFTPSQIQQMREYLEQARKHCVRHFEVQARNSEGQMRRLQEELRRRSRSLTEARRKDLHCRIQSLREETNQAQTLAKQAIPVAFDNREAKLDLIQNWPSALRQTQQELASGTYHNRPFADVKDIGFREVGRGQEDDIKSGEEAIEQMKKSGLLPPEVEDSGVRKYVTELAQKIAARSDLRVPLRVTVLNSKEINAFALPGGFLFVQRGLLESVEDESQLAGVFAHEIAHAAARHGHRLMKKATIASLIYQAAQVAAMIFTGGAVGIGAYYALQYGFFGLGLVLSLDLLGVSREFELEADQLGVQYAWNAEYDPSGFIRFFGKLATREGYVKGASWFRTHPPFYQRMVHTQREILFLPKKDQLIVQTSAFEEMKKALKQVTAQAQEEEKDRPSLLAPEKSCPTVERKEYRPGQRIETLCELPAS